MRWNGMVFGLASMLTLAGCASTDTEAPMVNLTGSGQTVAQQAPTLGQHSATVAAGPTGYTVQKGDTLYSIALEKGLDYHDLATWNHLNNINHIRVGQVLQIHPPGAESGQGAANAQAIPLQPTAVTAQPVGAVTSINQPQAVKLRWSPAAVKQIESADAASSSSGTGAGTGAAAQPAASPSSSAAAPRSAASPGAPTASTGDWVWPTDGSAISQFGGSGVDGKGIDISGARGQAVDAVAAGKVLYVGTIHGYGKLVIIKHSTTITTVYAHNDEVMVKEGQMVARGQQIAKMGDSDADRVELHFEVRKLGQPVDPMKFLPPAAP